MNEKGKIGFDDLNTSLKVLVVLGWIMAALWMLGFLVGFVIGVIGY